MRLFIARLQLGPTHDGLAPDHLVTHVGAEADGRSGMLLKDGQEVDSDDTETMERLRVIRDLRLAPPSADDIAAALEQRRESQLFNGPLRRPTACGSRPCPTSSARRSPRRNGWSR